ncbi:DUF3040 domain-containing protein [Carbonactinospora thermoautotrophica]|uniref:Membrane protein n=1 Tax=Carbonactinospora thermoautotrophica TaxID=1469144 RepID=A0A132MW61_9ACTN|nr:DUF3040 domain-containing protein [Carbonactinospora thermoautotrophica]KWX00317.1 membrane protein [Carbonactinospora thermoautotrophica]KWX01602.1 putative membrane protein [Carbonactinospora thermoautotrophica]KWX07848.1 membrane protein [Carbonactinospora thermoautotrophica]MCX9190777.1 DUF3040 domain-containing protein [Carbonactinospora thermoautotrophica]
MPLSEHEQRLLEQMERALYAEDPKFAAALRGADLRSHFRRRTYQALAVFVLGVVLLMAGVITTIWPVSVLGFLVMLAGAVFAVSSWRRIPGPSEVLPMAGPASRHGRVRSRFMDRLEERWRRRRDEQGR